jgi:hypothetical protein
MRSERFARLKKRITRLQLIACLGLFSLILGTTVSFRLVARLGPRLPELPAFLSLLIQGIVAHLWLLMFLPALAYLAARIWELKPYQVAVGGPVAGELFLQAIGFASNGLATFVPEWPSSVLHLLAVVGGATLTSRAVWLGREAAASGNAMAQSQADARRDEYAEFLREAERIAHRTPKAPP